MGKKVFVSYKHSDNSVQDLNYGNTARAYVDYLMYHTLKNEVYKGEGDEDLSEFKDETIKTHLKDKIHNSSITVVLISPKMKESYRQENDQWIPWEISYSLKEITRDDRMSHSNGILAVVLPDSLGHYDYFIEDKSCNCRTLKTNTLFQILRNNMFNEKNLRYSNCSYCNSYAGDSSYITSVKWQDFINEKNYYLDKAAEIRDNRKSYNITKEVNNGC